MRSAGAALVLGLVLGLGSPAVAGSVKLPKARTFLESASWAHHAPYLKARALPRPRTVLDQVGWGHTHSGRFGPARYRDINWGRTPVRLWPVRRSPASLALP